MDKIEIKSLNISTNIGVHAWEQRILQRLLIDMTLYLDLSLCKNDLSNSVDYDALCTRVSSFVTSQSFTLIETVAEEIAALVKAEFKLSQIEVRVTKPDAIKQTNGVSVWIQR